MAVVKLECLVRNDDVICRLEALFPGRHMVSNVKTGINIRSLPVIGHGSMPVYAYSCKLRDFL